jgi:hypothetical protein
VIVRHEQIVAASREGYARIYMNRAALAGAP